MWILNNSKTLAEKLADKGPLHYRDVTTWDFSTLYTTIPHNDLIERINKLIISVFQKTGHQYINVKSNKKRQIRHPIFRRQPLSIAKFIIQRPKTKCSLTNKYKVNLGQ